MEPLESMLRYGAVYHAEGNNGVILAVDRHSLHAAGVDAEALCPAFKKVSRVALKIVRQSISGMAADEREKHITGVRVLDKSGKDCQVKMPAILDDCTSGFISTPDPLIRLTGILPPGKHVEFLLMDWVEGTDFATLAYRCALRSGLQHTLEEYGESQALHETRSALKVFLDAKIMMSAMRIPMDSPQAKQAQRLGGRLRQANREGDGLLGLWRALLPEARKIAIESLHIGEMMEAMMQLDQGNMAPAIQLIDEQLDATALEIVIVTINSMLMLDYTPENTRRGRRDAFLAMVRDLIRGNLVLPASMRVNLERTLRCLNQQGYFHNDLHERNIMISANNKDLYIIDMATATHNEQTTGNDMSILAPHGLFYAATEGT